MIFIIFIRNIIDRLSGVCYTPAWIKDVPCFAHVLSNLTSGRAETLDLIEEISFP